MTDPLGKAVILRHDVDLLPKNALTMAKVENGLGVVSTYYFRAVPESFDEGVIREIAGMGHEVGYHYESLTTALIAQRRRGAEGEGTDVRCPMSDVRCPMSDVGCQRAEGGGRKSGVGGPMSGVRGQRTEEERLYEVAYEDFKRNLERLRKLVPVRTICMHGSPLSRVSNLDLWKRYDYRELGILGELYRDVDFDEVFYLTDTGRRWDGEAVSVRDRVKAQNNHLAQSCKGAKKKQDDSDGWRDVRGRRTEGEEDKKVRGLEVKRWPRFHSTFDIILAAESGKLPDKTMMTVHPQRWDDRPWPWVSELVAQNIKNVVKRILVRRLRR